jgi:hypothetical protein
MLSYEQAIRPLQVMAVLLGTWASPEQRPTLSRILSRLSDNCIAAPGGNVLWGGLRWYPISLLMYSAGIAALSVENYPSFAAVHTKRISAPTRGGGNATVDILLPVVDAMFDVSNTGVWKCHEEYKQKRTPESEHLFKVLHPVLEDSLFLGAEYAPLFDRYEILRSLHYADITDGAWGPVGRFAWKHYGRMGRENSPYTALRNEAVQFRDKWGPIQAGLFRGSYARFEQTATRFETELLDKLNWH